MRQVELVVQVETDEQADAVMETLTEMAGHVDFALLDPIDVFVADDLGTVSRP